MQTSSIINALINFPCEGRKRGNLRAFFPKWVIYILELQSYEESCARNTTYNHSVILDGGAGWQNKFPSTPWTSAGLHHTELDLSVDLVSSKM